MLWAQLWAEAEAVGTPAGVTATLVVAFTGLLALMSWPVKHLLTTTLPSLTTSYQAALAAQLVEAGKLREQYDLRQAALLLHCEGEADKERQAGERRYIAAVERLERVEKTGAEQLQLLRAWMQQQSQRNRLADVVISAEDAIWSKTLDGIITSWNGAAERLLGWRGGETVERPVYMLIPPDLHQQERDTLEAVRRGERVERYDTERLHRDGRRVRLSVTTSPLKDPAGKVVGASSIAREV